MSPRRPVVIVTGASRGIGLAVVQKLLSQHVNVAAISRSQSPELQALSSDSLLPIQCDVADEETFVQAISQVKAKFKYIDGLILNAGTLDPLCRIGDATPLSAWKTHFDVNFFSLITAIGACLPALRTSELGGRIVLVSSGASIKGTAGWGPYNASKAAMNSLCRTLAEEEPNVTSVALRPGMVNTGMQAKIRDEAKDHMKEVDHGKFVNQHTSGELLSPELPGNVIAMLSLQAPASLSGKFVSWDEEVCKPFRV